MAGRQQMAWSDHDAGTEAGGRIDSPAGAPGKRGIGKRVAVIRRKDIAWQPHVLAQFQIVPADAVELTKDFGKFLRKRPKVEVLGTQSDRFLKLDPFGTGQTDGLHRGLKQASLHF